MLLGRVAGTVVASRKEPLIEGWKLLVVRQLDTDNRDVSRYVVAVNTVGAADPGNMSEMVGDPPGVGPWHAPCISSGTARRPGAQGATSGAGGAGHPAHEGEASARQRAPGPATLRRVGSRPVEQVCHAAPGGDTRAGQGDEGELTASTAPTPTPPSPTCTSRKAAFGDAPAPRRITLGIEAAEPSTPLAR